MAAFAETDGYGFAVGAPVLIGDSITRGYGPQVEADLKWKAYVGRMATSKSLGDPALLERMFIR